MSADNPVALVLGSGQLGLELARLPASYVRLRVAVRDEIDVTDAAAMRAAVIDIAPAIVLNATAYTAVDKAETEREVAFAVNRDGPAALAAICDDLRIPLVHVSTDYVFDGQRGPYLESAATSPQSVYGESKLAGEDAIRVRLDRHIILRTAWVFSAFGNNFVKTMLRLAATRPEIDVVDDQTGCPTPAAALAQAMLTLVERFVSAEAPAWGTYHFAGRPATTWRRFAEEIFAQATRAGLLPKAPKVNPITSAQYPTAARRPSNSVLDCGALARLGLAAPDWREGLGAVISELYRVRTAAEMAS